jgi:hypothetical protein
MRGHAGAGTDPRDTHARAQVTVREAVLDLLHRRSIERGVDPDRRIHILESEARYPGSARGTAALPAGRARQPRTSGEGVRHAADR